jgi:hypothetical protein
MTSRPDHVRLLDEWNRQREGEDGDTYTNRIGYPPQHICEAYERSLIDVDANDGASFQGNLQPAARPRANTPVPDKFPGERGIMRANMILFLLVIFRLMEQICPHFEIERC